MKEKRLIIGLCGPPRAGKTDGVARYLVESHGAIIISISDIVRELCRVLSLDVTRANCSRLADAIKSGFEGESVFANAALARVGTAFDHLSYVAGLSIVVIDRLVYPDEAREGFKRLAPMRTLFVDAHAEIRFERRLLGGNPKPDEIAMTMEQFLAQQDVGPERFLDGLRDMADAEIPNNHTLDDLHAEVDAVLDRWLAEL